MTKVNCRLKVNWNDVAQKYFTIQFTCSESCALSKVIYQTMKMNWKYIIAIDFRWLQLTLLKIHEIKNIF